MKRVVSRKLPVVPIVPLVVRREPLVVALDFAHHQVVPSDRGELVGFVLLVQALP